MLIFSSFSVVFLALFSASDIMLVHCLFFTASVIFSACDGIFSSAAFHFFSTVSSSETSSRASSGQDSMHLGSPSQRSQAMATRVSGSRMSPPYGQAWMHQSQPLHLRWSIVSRPVFSAWVMAFSVQAFAHGASLQNRQLIVVLSMDVRRITRILDFRGSQLWFFSCVHAYSQMPQPVHLLGSTDTNFLESSLAVCIVVTVCEWDCLVSSFGFVVLKSCSWLLVF